MLLLCLLLVSAVPLYVEASLGGLICEWAGKFLKGRFNQSTKSFHLIQSTWKCSRHNLYDLLVTYWIEFCFKEGITWSCWELNRLRQATLNPNVKIQRKEVKMHILRKSVLSCKQGLRKQVQNAAFKIQVKLQTNKEIQTIISLFRNAAISHCVVAGIGSIPELLSRF